MTVDHHNPSYMKKNIYIDLSDNQYIYIFKTALENTFFSEARPGGTPEAVTESFSSPKCEIRGGLPPNLDFFRYISENYQKRTTFFFQKFIVFTGNY